MEDGKGITKSKSAVNTRGGTDSGGSSNSAATSGTGDGPTREALKAFNIIVKQLPVPPESGGSGNKLGELGLGYEVELEHEK